MKMFPAKLTLNQKFAAAAFVFALLAAVVSIPKRGNSNLNLQELASLVENEKDHIDANELADWIMQKRNDYILIDTREKSLYDEYHIPTADNISLQKLINENFPADKKIVIYSEGGTHGAQGWFFLKSKGYKKVYFLRYGLNEWIDDLLFPKVSKELYESNSEEYQNIARKAAFFGGEVELTDSTNIKTKSYRREGC